MTIYDLNAPLAAQQQQLAANGYWVPYTGSYVAPDARSLVESAKTRLVEVEKQLAQRDTLEKEAKQLRAILEAAEKAL